MAEPVFDPERSWSALDARAKRERDPRRRRLLEQVSAHMRTEIRGQLEPLMATLVDDPRYHFWGQGEDTAPKGRDAVHAFYTQMLAAGGNRFEVDVRRIVVDDDAVVTEGKLRTLVPGAALLEAGTREVDGAAVEPEATYVSEMQLLTVWPAGPDGRLIGEDIYFGGGQRILARVA